MTLNTEMPRDIPQPPFSSAGSAVKAKESERKEIEELTKQFLRKKKNRIIGLPHDEGLLK
jgi:hypothetical protein